MFLPPKRGKARMGVCMLICHDGGLPPFHPHPNPPPSWGGDAVCENYEFEKLVRSFRKKKYVWNCRRSRQ